MADYRRRQSRKKLYSHKRDELNEIDIPSEISWRHKIDKVYDQKQEGSCTSNSYCSHVKAVGIQANPSRYFHYVCERLNDSKSLPVTDLGADLFYHSAASSTGVCDENFMPYVVDENGHLIGFGKLPSPEAYANARLHIHPPLQNLTPVNLDLIVKICKSQLAKGFLINCGFLVFASFESEAVKDSGMMPVPSAKELSQAPLGGHEVLILGASDSKQCFECLNSWGDWGLGGFFYMPYQFMLTRTSRGEPCVGEICTLPVACMDVPVQEDVEALIQRSIVKLEDVLKELKAH
ncbi:MAG: hypothetical protein V4481_04780 [Patescibacteria group bacterium]